MTGHAHFASRPASRAEWDSRDESVVGRDSRKAGNLPGEADGSVPNPTWFGVRKMFFQSTLKLIGFQSTVETAGKVRPKDIFSFLE